MIRSDDPEDLAFALTSFLSGVDWTRSGHELRDDPTVLAAVKLCGDRAWAGLSAPDPRDLAV